MVGKNTKKILLLMGFLVGIAFLWTESPARAEVSFIARKDFAAGRNPIAVTSADFNGDVHPDLAVANWNSNNVSVLLGYGDGTFALSQNFDVGRGPSSIAVGDFNRDSIPDLAVASEGELDRGHGVVSILLGRGDGTFAAARSLAVEPNPGSIAVGDFNRDGIPDLVMTHDGLPDTLGAVAVLLGRGDGTFRPALYFAVGMNPSSLVVGDFNSDGVPDLAVTNFMRRYRTPDGISYYGRDNIVSILLGNGDGTFEPARNFELDPGSGPVSAVAGDFNGDTILDLAVLTTDHSVVYVLLGNGDGTFALSGQLKLLDKLDSAAVADFNDDGIPDLAVITAHSKGLFVFLGKGDGTFKSSRAIEVGRPVHALVVGDFNGDSLPDLAGTDFGLNSVCVVLGQRDGMFRLAPTIDVGNLPSAVVVGDFNRDSKLDIAVAGQGSNDVSLITGNGDGTFQSAPDSVVEGDLRAVGDFNGDGISDLVLVRSDYPYSYMSVHLGGGDGTFRSAQTLRLGNEYNTVVVGDFNGDKIPDLAMIWPIMCCPPAPDGFTILLGNGDGTFGSPRSFGTEHYHTIAVGDFDGDSIQDLALAHSGNQVSIFLGNGDGTFELTHRFAVGLAVSSLSVGDFDGDGHQDLAAISQDALLNSAVFVLLGNGDGTFRPGRATEIGWFARSVAVGDFNGDMILDLAMANTDVNAPYPYLGRVSVLLGNGDGTFGPAQHFESGRDPSDVVIGDFDGDQILDLAVANTFNAYPTPATVSILMGKGDGTFRAAQNLMVGWFAGWVHLADFNRDQVPDLAVADRGRVSIVFGNSDGTFPAAQITEVGCNPSSVVAGDLDEDGIPDLIVTNPRSEKVSILLGNGDRTFRSAQTIKMRAAPWSATLGDLDGDSVLDLALVDGSSNLAILTGIGDGTFYSPQYFPLGFDPSAIAAGDFNGDNHMDLALTDWRFNRVRILLGRGDGTFRVAQAFAVGKHPWSIAVGDFNGDGKPDLVTADRADNAVSVLLGNGDGTFQAAQAFTAGAKPTAVIVGDFDGDGRPDLAVANWDSNNVSILVGEGNGRFRAAQHFGVGFSPSALAAGDFNGDGRSDLVVANWGGHNVSVLINDR